MCVARASVRSSCGVSQLYIHQGSRAAKPRNPLFSSRGAEDRGKGMRTRSQSKREENPPAQRDSEPQTRPAHGSRPGKVEATVKNSKRVASRKASGGKQRQESPVSFEETEDEVGVPAKNSGELHVKEELTRELGLKGCGGNMEGSTLSKGENAGGSIRPDVNEMDWEEGTISVLEVREGYSHDLGRDVTVEFTESPSAAQRKPSRRASAHDKAIHRNLKSSDN